MYAQYKKQPLYDVFVKENGKVQSQAHYSSPMIVCIVLQQSKKL